MGAQSLWACTSQGEQVARLPNSGGVITCSKEPHPYERKEWGIYEAIDCAFHDATHPRMMAAVAGCLVLLMVLLWDLWGEQSQRS